MKRAGNAPLERECSFCKAPAVADVPTVYGGWGYVCMRCYEIHAAPGAAQIGFRIV